MSQVIINLTKEKLRQTMETISEWQAGK